MGADIAKNLGAALSPAMVLKSSAVRRSEHDGDEKPIFLVGIDLFQVQFNFDGRTACSAHAQAEQRKACGPRLLSATSDSDAHANQARHAFKHVATHVVHEPAD